MKRNLVILLGLLGILMLINTNSAFANERRRNREVVVVNPKPQINVHLPWLNINISSCQRQRFVWIAGYWQRQGHCKRYAWVPGHWEKRAKHYRQICSNREHER